MLLAALLPMSAGAGSGSAERPERPVIRLSCAPQPGGLGEALCRALMLALGEMSAGAGKRAALRPVIRPVIRHVPAGAERPVHPGDLGVALDGGNGALRLRWQRSSGGVQHGPALRVPGGGSAKTLPQNSVNLFARKLVQVSSGLYDSLPGAPNRNP